MKGLIHIYHGDGKGKTTAAMGLVLRAVGNGQKAVIVQFLKGRDSGEIGILQSMPGVAVFRGKHGTKFSFQMSEEEKQAARKAHRENLDAAWGQVKVGNCSLLVLDEALGALSTGLLEEDPIRQLIDDKPPELEIVLTGREPPDFLLRAADYITEMKCVRHPYDKGIPARKGIEF